MVQRYGLTRFKPAVESSDTTTNPVRDPNNVPFDPSRVKPQIYPRPREKLLRETLHPPVLDVTGESQRLLDNKDCVDCPSKVHISINMADKSQAKLSEEDARNIFTSDVVEKYFSRPEGSPSTIDISPSMSIGIVLNSLADRDNVHSEELRTHRAKRSSHQRVNSKRKRQCTTATPIKRRRPSTVSSEAEDVDNADEIDSDEPDEPERKDERNEFVMEDIRVDQLREKYYDRAWRSLGQKACKEIAKAWIKACHPKRQTSNPYNGGIHKDRSLREYGYAGHYTKTDYWPSDEGWRDGLGVRYKEPDHIKRRERVMLLNALLRREEYGFTLNKLEESTKSLPSKNPEYWTAFSLELLIEIYRARLQERRYENGEIDGSAKVKLHVPKKAINMTRQQRTMKQEAVEESEGEQRPVIDMGSISQRDAGVATARTGMCPDPCEISKPSRSGDVSLRIGDVTLSETTQNSWLCGTRPPHNGLPLSTASPSSSRLHFNPEADLIHVEMTPIRASSSFKDHIKTETSNQTTDSRTWAGPQQLDTLMSGSFASEQYQNLPFRPMARPETFAGSSSGLENWRRSFDTSWNSTSVYTRGGDPNASLTSSAQTSFSSDHPDDSIENEIYMDYGNGIGSSYGQQLSYQDSFPSFISSNAGNFPLNLVQPSSSHGDPGPLRSGERSFFLLPQGGYRL